jgi:prepilin-type N-terminal cleavage/methylation domain-containing protein
MKRPGFTLIEVLVVIAIITVLIAISVTWLAGSRRSARDTKSLGNLRMHAAAMNMYATDHNACFPYFTFPGHLTGVLVGGGIRVEAVSYFDAFQFWHVALADGYYNVHAASDAFHPPQSQLERDPYWPYASGYHYPCAFIATPEYWNPETRRGPEQWRRTRTDQVLFPASKTLMVESWVPGRAGQDMIRTTPLPVATCDGSARNLKWGERMSGYQRGDGVQFMADGAVHFGDVPSLLHTSDGVRGRDIQ